MPELRQNRITKEWVIIATERAKRPEELVVKTHPAPLPAYSPTCPFCPGNERFAPEPILTRGNGDQWRVRVIPNKFPALDRNAEPAWHVERNHRSVVGAGIHDVIVEGQDHSLTTALLPEETVQSIVNVYYQRYVELCADLRVAHTIIFKNHGVAAGTSLEHPHSQLIATPVISHQVRNRLFESLRHWDETGQCIFCEQIRDEMDEGVRVVIQTQHFIAFQPYASPSPFYTYVFPLRHQASFDEITDPELADLARVLRAILGKLYFGLQNPDFNYTLRSAPADSAGVKFYHWYFAIIPRLTRVAGFELGTGMFINTVMPEAAAEFLRSVKVEEAVQATA